MMSLQNALLLAALLLSLCGGARGAAGSVRAPAAELDPVAGEVIVRFKADAALLRRHALAPRADTEQVRKALTDRAKALGLKRGWVLEAGASLGERSQVVRRLGADARELARQLATDPEVEFAVPNARLRRQAAPNDPLYAQAALGIRPQGPDSGQWYLRAPAGDTVSGIDIEAAWARTQGRASVVVAVLDTGVRFEHPDLGRAANGGRLLPGYDFVSDRVVANDGDGRDAP